MNKKIIDFIKKKEGLVLKAYKCQAGVWTIGYGTTKYSNGKYVKENDTITPQQAEKELIYFCEKEIKPFIKNLNLNDNQEIALYSLCYNIGIPNFLQSKCYMFLKQKDYNNAVKEWNWIKANGRILKGLVIRRNEEIELFFGIKNYLLFSSFKFF